MSLKVPPPTELATQRVALNKEDRTQRLCSKTRMGVFSVLGAALTVGAGALALYKDISGLLGTINNAFNSIKFDTFAGGYLKGLTGTGYGRLAALGCAGAVGGGVLGALVGKVTAHKASLNDLKGKLGVDGSDLSFSQLQRVADVAVKGILRRSTSVTFKSDVDRMKNLNDALTLTEYSLGRSAHDISKARGVEDRYFSVEGSKLASSSNTTAFLEGWTNLKEAVNAVVKETDKYTYQQGNAATSISRRDYMLKSIRKFAHQNGIAGRYLTSLVIEQAGVDPKTAAAQLKEGLKAGLASGILAPHKDPKCYEGMVNAGAVASMVSRGKNPDAVISSMFDKFRDAGLIPGNLRARFIADVREKMVNPNAVIVNPMPIQNAGSMVDLADGQVGTGRSNGFQPDNVQSKPRSEDSLNDPNIETSAQRKARLAAEKQAEIEEKQAQIDAEVYAYIENLGSLDPRQKELISLYEKLIQLLTEKSVPLKQIMEMGPRRLRGALTKRHKEDFDLFRHYEANDGAIATTKEAIIRLTDEMNAARSARPGIFKTASKAHKLDAEALERQIRLNDAQISKLHQRALALGNKIAGDEGTLSDNEGRVNAYLFPPTESSLPKPVASGKGAVQQQNRSEEDVQPLVEEIQQVDPQVEGNEEALPNPVI